MSQGISHLVAAWFIIWVGCILPCCYGTELTVTCAEQSDGSLACSFVLDPTTIDAASTTLALSLSKSCVSKDDGQLCISGAVQIVSTTSDATTRNDQGTPPLSPEAEEQTVVVGSATYAPPFSQHGTHVKQILQNAPSSKESSIEWAEWCLDLASAHHVALSQEDGSSTGTTTGSGTTTTRDQVWEQLELAINAYHEAIRTMNLVIQTSSTTTSITDHDIFLARAHYFLGEAYFFDPSLKYLDQAVDAYRESHRLYAKLVQTAAQAPSGEYRPEIETRYAEACTKLGMALLSSLDHMEAAPSWMMTMMMMMMDSPFSSHHSNTNKKKSDSLSQIQEYFATAIQIYEQYFDAPILSELDRQELQFSYASALQQAASLAIMQGRLTDAKQTYLRALDLQMMLLPRLASATSPSMDTQSSHMAIADTLLSLADTCVQLGDYDCAKKTYRQAMEFHEKHKIEVAPMMPLEGDRDEDMSDWNRAILETMEALKEYRLHSQGGKGRYWRSFSDPLNMAGSGGEYMYEKDDGYEGDLLASLGTMYLSIGDPRAILHLEQAKDKYSSSRDDKNSPAMADLLMNLSMAYYRNYQFQDSQRVHGQALDIYRRLYGDGVNPYMQGMENWMTMPPNMPDGFHSHHSHWHHHGGTFSHSSSYNSDRKDHDDEVPSGKEPNSPPSQILIDLELFKQSIQNETEELSQHDFYNGEL